MAYAHQDWTTVVLKKRVSSAQSERVLQSRDVGNKQGSDNPSIKKQKLDQHDHDDFRPLKV